MTLSQVTLNSGTLLRPRPSFLSRPDSPPSPNSGRSWTQLQRRVNCNSRFSCLFSDNRREDQARKSLESSLGGKKNKFKKWNKEIKRRGEKRLEGEVVLPAAAVGLDGQDDLVGPTTVTSGKKRNRQAS